MVCQLTADEKGFEASADELRRRQGRADELRTRLLAGVDADTDAYMQIVAAFRLPKETADEKAARAAAVEAATRHATDVPLQTAEASLEVLELASGLGVRGGALNVAINLQGLPDDDATAEVRRHIAAVEDCAQEVLAETWPVVHDLAVGRS